MTRLEPMRSEAFASFIESSLVVYAADHAAVGRWPQSESLRLARAEFERLLPQGLATPDNHLYDIVETAGGGRVGGLWVGISRRGETSTAYVHQVGIRLESRRRGHARRALEALEGVVAGMGVYRIGLHVFGHNPGAQALYAALGYKISGINMIKNLEERAVS